MIDIIKEPKGLVYESLLDTAFEICDEFILVVRDQINFDLSGQKIIELLKPALKEVKKQSEWPGTQLLGHYATIYYFYTNDNVKRVLKEAVDGLYSWVQPELPEDLCFIKEDGKCWLATIAHERMAWFEDITPDDINIIRNINGLKISENRE